MSTTTQPLKYLWIAQFADGHTINQPADDRYSKHDDNAEYNPSAFRDILEYSEISQLVNFELQSRSYAYGVDLRDGKFYTAIDNEGELSFSLEDEPLIDRKLIYYREMYQQSTLGGDTGEPFVNRYIIGYEGKDINGKVQKKVIYIDG